MSQTCAIESCKRSSCALCLCCQQKICLPHLKDHQELLISELNPMVDQINALGGRLKALNMENKIANARQKLDEWRVECHQKIDNFFQQKCRELDRQVAEKTDIQRGEISRIQSKAAELIREQHATRHDLDLLISRIHDLEQEMNKIEQASFDIRTQSLNVDDNWITIEEPRKYRFEISSLPSGCKTINVSDGGLLSVASSNDRFLLMHQKPNLCLVDRTLTIVKQSLWNNDTIYDMCWSSVLNRFIVISADNVFLVDQSKLSVEKLSITQGQKLYSSTCSEASLYLSTNRRGSSIIKYHLSPSIQLIEHWKPPDTCQENEIISLMRYNNRALALLITNAHTEAVRVELRTSKTLKRLWSFRLDVKDVQREAFCCCPINEDEWLVADHENRRLIQITNDGKLKATCAYSSTPWCLCTFGSDILVVFDVTGINFHKF